MQYLIFIIPVIVLIFVSILWMLERRIRKEVADIIFETIDILRKTDDRRIHMELVDILEQVYLKLDKDSTVQSYETSLGTTEEKFRKIATPRG